MRTTHPVPTTPTTVTAPRRSAPVAPAGGDGPATLDEALSLVAAGVDVPAPVAPPARVVTAAAATLAPGGGATAEAVPIPVPAARTWAPHVAVLVLAVVASWALVVGAGAGLWALLG